MSPDIDALFAANKSFCALPWVQVSATIDGVFGRCCLDISTYQGDHYHAAQRPKISLADDVLGCLDSSPYAEDNSGRVETINSAFNSDAMCRTRRAMIAGDRIAACQQCHWAEAHGVKSFRQYANEEYRDSVNWEEVFNRTSDGRLDGKPVSLDLRLGNQCNLRCQMCGYPTSHAFKSRIKTWQKGVVDPYSDNSAFWEEMKQLAPSLRYIYFAGGEPLIQKAHMKMLRLLVSENAATQIDLGYNSNLTVIPEGLFELWARFRTVRVGASCDGIGQVFERIRVGASWPTFVQNLDMVRVRADVYLAVTIQKDNLMFLDELLQWADERGMEVSLRNVLQEPPSMRIDQLEREQIIAVENALRSRAEQLIRKGSTKLAREINTFCAALMKIHAAPEART